MTCSRRIALPGTALGALLLAARMVSAQPAAAHCEDVPACSQQFTEAQRLSKAGAHADALVKFKQLYGQYNDPVALYPIAIQLHRLGRHAEAISMYQRYIDSGHETDPTKIANVRERLSQAQAALDARAAKRVSSETTPYIATASAAAPTTPAVSGDISRVPLYKRWWLWTIVGVAVAGVVVGSAIGAYAKPPSYPDSMDLRPFP